MWWNRFLIVKNFKIVSTWLFQSSVMIGESVKIINNLKQTWFFVFTCLCFSKAFPSNHFLTNATTSAAERAEWLRALELELPTGSNSDKPRFCGFYHRCQWIEDFQLQLLSLRWRCNWIYSDPKTHLRSSTWFPYTRCSLYCLICIWWVL